jgi:hypothetical protein
MIEFYIIVLITNYPEDEVYSLAMKLDIEYVVEYVRLRFLEDVTCIIKSHQVTSEIYDFYCSKEVRGIISSISIISDNLVINGKEAVNSSTSEVAKNYGENMQNQTNKFLSERRKINETFDNCSVYTEDNKIIFKGENNRFKITSRDSLLVFGQDEYIKNIMCDISNERNNKFKMVCEPTFIVNVDFSGNNEVYINNLEKIVMMEFEEGKSFVILDAENNSNLKLFKKISSGGISKGPILFIIILFITLLVIIIIIVYLCKKPSKETNQKNETNPSEPSENKTTLPSESKDTVTKNNISGEAGLNISKDKKNL